MFLVFVKIFDRGQIASPPYGDGSLLGTHFYDKYRKPIPLSGKSVTFAPSWWIRSADRNGF
ncbi:hypothetical protein [Herbaspirillum huttiense]|uniref:hypothetical protein n=1 Tax=Herbaspirillum huttiense TaxID=863372 RepID=UPI0031E05814